MTDRPLYAELGYTDAEWGLLAGLPQSVLTAASAASPDSARKTRAETAAGLDRISDARASASVLVSAAAKAAVAESGDPEIGEEAPVIQPGDPVAYAADVVSRAAEAAALLAAKAAPADAETYKHWLVEIADEVVGAASTGGVLGIGGETVTDAERAFRDDLAKALGH
ncbi:hypothetical protein [Actinoplanes couchii]|uniref:hypothetical protein n=1 Tax=Actinoplanes couchii TaxID=403638 RepID=UPI00194412F3|nr:hypothetical protein [Actinoplanes couchii]MDR6326248.1 hypothetical protein [Actinoplanes couchii]